MSDASPISSRARAERRAVARDRRARRASDERANRGPKHLHIVVLVLSLLLTFGASLTSYRLVEERVSARFERETDRLAGALSQRLARYEDAMQAGIAALDASGGRMDRRAWQRFARGLHLSERYPGVHGIGFIERIEANGLDAFVAREQLSMANFTVHPPSDATVLYPIVFIEPENQNFPAIGLDIGFEAQRRQAAASALDTGRSTITAPIELVQDETMSASFLFFAPYLGAARPTAAPDAVTGLVYAPFVVSDLIAGTLDPALRSIDIAVHDGDTVLFDEAGSDHPPESDQGTTRRRNVTIDVYGRSWRLEFDARAGFESASSRAQPWLVLIGGILIDLMLFIVIISFTRANRALRASAILSRSLDERSRALEQTNRELERFACVASHDLKTPLRGIADLAWYLREDLADVLLSPDRGPLINDHLLRLERQTGRMEALVEGILDYSGIGRQQGGASRFDTGELLAAIAETLSVPDSQLKLDGVAPVIETERVPFEQVLSNLVGNAFKYHHDPSSAQVTVSFSLDGNNCTVRVEDDGPGIDARFHQRIFEMFETLQPKDVIESTGIGLAIVKKLVDRRGGVVSLESEPGRGSIFTVRWPLLIDACVAEGDLVEPGSDSSRDSTAFSRAA